MGMIIGTLIAVSIMITNKLGMNIPAKPWGIHAGVWGLMINVSTIYIMEKLSGFKNK